MFLILTDKPFSASIIIEIFIVFIVTRFLECV